MVSMVKSRSLSDSNSNAEEPNVPSKSQPQYNASTASHVALKPDTTASTSESPSVSQQVGRQVYKAEASLYCRKNGHPHAVLLDFNIKICPACSTDLTPPKPVELESEAYTQPVSSIYNIDDLQARFDVLRGGTTEIEYGTSKPKGKTHIEISEAEDNEPYLIEQPAEESSVSKPSSTRETQGQEKQQLIEPDIEGIPGFFLDEVPSFRDDIEPYLTGTSNPIHQNVDFQDHKGISVETKDWSGKYLDLKPLASSRRLDEGRTVIGLSIIIRSNLTDEQLRKHRNYGRFLQDTELSWTYHGTTLVIFSQVIVDAINAVAAFSLRLPDTAPVTLLEPYAVLGYSLEGLKDHVATLDSAESSQKPSMGEDTSTTQPRVQRHLNILLEWLQQLDYEKQLLEETERNSRGVCTFRMLWLLFPPGSSVCMESQGLLSGYVIESITPRGPFANRREVGILTSDAVDKLRYVVTLWNLKCRDKFVGRVRTKITIGFFRGEKAISSLKIVPMKMLETFPGLPSLADLEIWGRKWFRALRGSQVYYNGPDTNRIGEKVEGRAFLDGYAILTNSHDRPEDIYANGDDDDDDDPTTWHPRRRAVVKCSCDQCHGMRIHPSPEDPWRDYDVIDTEKTDSLELTDNPHGRNHRYLVCDRRILALMLKTRFWVMADIACCKEPIFNEAALKTLVMASEPKSLIMALVSKFKSTRAENHVPSWHADAIEGKGEGMIILLHGGPGVGKTFTAECIAEFTRKPLISLTSADIGTRDNEVESNLNIWLRNAERWSAILLIDEADVYLETRRSGDLKRNSLVSVFLRCLEYYRGILFLTTNRVGQFDDAFISRVHVVINYDSLGERERRRIWKNFFDKLEKDRPNFVVNASALEYAIGDEGESLCKLEWNGREIRNAFQTAIALADFRAQTEDEKRVVLRTSDLQQVAKMMQSFKTYLKNLHGLTEDQRAYVARTRFDADKM